MEHVTRIVEQVAMYAVFRTGGKQYRASKGAILRLEKLDVDEGANVKFDEVLLVGEGSEIQVGSPLLAGTSVNAKVIKQGKTKKVSVVKFRRRQNYLRQHTHRQFFTDVEITSISGDSKLSSAGSDAKSVSKEKASAKKKPAAKKAAAKKKPAAKKAAAKKKPAAKKAANKSS